MSFAGLVDPHRALPALLLLVAGLPSVAPAQGAGHFRPVAIYVDTGDEPLAAYQLELLVTQGEAMIVGVEGGEHPAFREAPYYDPAALQGGRIILAAFSTGADLPRGRTRIGTVHVREIDGQAAEYEPRLIVCATRNGERIPAQAAAIPE